MQRVRVVARIRPKLEYEGKQEDAVVQTSPTTLSVTLRSPTDKNSVLLKAFSFDRVFPPGATQATVFLESGVTTLVDQALDGYR